MHTELGTDALQVESTWCCVALLNPVWLDLTPLDWTGLDWTGLDFILLTDNSTDVFFTHSFTYLLTYLHTHTHTHTHTHRTTYSSPGRTTVADPLSETATLGNASPTGKTVGDTRAGTGSPSIKVSVSMPVAVPLSCGREASSFTGIVELPAESGLGLGRSRRRGLWDLSEADHGDGESDGAYGEHSDESESESGETRSISRSGSLTFTLQGLEVPKIARVKTKRIRRCTDHEASVEPASDTSSCEGLTDPSVAAAAAVAAAMTEAVTNYMSWRRQDSNSSTSSTTSDGALSPPPVLQSVDSLVSSASSVHDDDDSVLSTNSDETNSTTDSAQESLPASAGTTPPLTVNIEDSDLDNISLQGEDHDLSMDQISPCNANSRTSPLDLAVLGTLMRQHSIPMLSSQVDEMKSLLQRTRAISQTKTKALVRSVEIEVQRTKESPEYAELQELKARADVEEQELLSKEEELATKESELASAGEAFRFTEQFAGWTCVQQVATEERAGLRLRLIRDDILVRFELVAEWEVATGDLVEPPVLTLDYAPLTMESLTSMAEKQNISVDTLRTELCQQSAFIRALFNHHIPSLYCSLTTCKTQKQVPALVTELHMRLSRFFDMAAEVRNLMAYDWRESLSQSNDETDADLKDMSKLEQVSVTVSVQPPLSESSLYPSSSYEFSPFIERFACFHEKCYGLAARPSKRMKSNINHVHWKILSDSFPAVPLGLLDGQEGFTLDDFVSPRPPRLHVTIAHGPTLRQVTLDLPMSEAYPLEPLAGRRTAVLETDDEPDDEAEQDGAEVSNRKETTINTASREPNPTATGEHSLRARAELVAAKEQEQEHKHGKTQLTATDKSQFQQRANTEGSQASACIDGAYYRQGARLQVVAAGAVGFTDSKVAAQFLRSRAAQAVLQSRGYGRLHKIRNAIIRSFDE